jgi:hypothetical protein
LSQRALPNQRLVSAFGIDNAFTTTDPIWHAKFVHDAKEKIRITDTRHWKTLATAAADHITRRASKLCPTGSGSIHLVPFIQVLVFNIVMMQFFPEIAVPSEDDVKTITSLINTLWLASKQDQDHPSSSTSTSQFEKHKAELSCAIPKVFGVYAKGRDNPLNILIPAYETLWRIVLRAFLEIRFRSAVHSDLTPIFRRFIENPSRLTFELSHYSSGISIKHLVNESLRLYPPTRRIYRQMGLDDGARKERLGVDVEALQRQESIWGNNALDWDPRRWVNKIKTNEGFVPFGMGKFECPARGSFGPMMVGVLVGSLVLGFPDKDGVRWEVADEAEREGLEEIFGGAGVPLQGGREAYVGLRLVKVID